MLTGGGASWSQRLFGTGPFARLAKTHGSIVAADALFAVSLAGSLFFSVSVDAARPRVILYLALTMAPFAVVTPLVGPFIDRVRGGQRLVIALTGIGRAVACLAMAGELRTLLFYPLAFSVLVLGKTYSVAKNALVPRVVDDDETLVWANSRLSRTASIAGAVAGLLGAGVLAVSSAPWVLRVAGALYLVAAALAAGLPRPARPASARVAVLRAELRTPALRLAASAMGIVRGAEGFLLFLLAFALKQSGAPTWLFGAVLAATGIGSFAGTFVAPYARRLVSEPTLLVCAITATAAAGLLASLDPGRLAMGFVAVTLGTASNVGRRAFDSLVQREAPAVERGRLFARFETRFQLSWVLGALVAVALRPPLWAGFLLLGGIAGLGALSYGVGLRGARRGRDGREPDDGGQSSARADELLDVATRLRDEGRFAAAVIVAAAAAGDDARRGAGLDRLRRDAVGGRSISAQDAARAIALAARTRPGADGPSRAPDR